jgi:hypothetical protein
MDDDRADDDVPCEGSRMNVDSRPVLVSAVASKASDHVEASTEQEREAKSAHEGEREPGRASLVAQPEGDEACDP